MKRHDVSYRCGNLACGKVFGSYKGLSTHINHRQECQLTYSTGGGPVGVTKPGSETMIFDVLVNDPPIAATAGQEPPTAAPTLDDNSDVEFPQIDSPDGSVNEGDTAELIRQGWELVHNNDPDVTFFDREDQPFTFTNERRVEVALLKVLNEIGAPLYAFKEIMDWAADAHHTQYNFTPQISTHEGQIAELQKWTNMSGMRPTQVHVTLAGDGLQLPVVRFDFITALLSLFNDTSLNRLENLVIDPANPYGRYVSPDGLLGEVNSGAFYDMAYENLVKDPTKDFMTCLILQMDKTTVSENADLHSHPVLFTLSCFDLETRNKAEAWRPLGYLPIERCYYSKSQWLLFTAGQKHVRFQQMCNVLLKEVIEAQAPGGLDDVLLRLGPYEKVVNLKIPVAFIIGDAQGGDYICSRSLNYNGETGKRSCRTCDVGPESMGLARPNMCRRIIQADIEKMIEDEDVEGLVALCQHACNNAFMKLCYGGSPFGVFTAAAPTEGLHQLEKGLLLLCLSELFDQRLPPALKRQLDKLAQDLCDLPSQRGMKSFRDHFPRLLFKDGITHLKNITASTVVGVMFTTIIVSLTRAGRRLFHSPECTRMDGSDYFDMIEVFESLLCFWAWLKKDKYWKCGDEEATRAAEEATCILMRKMRQMWARTTGIGWNNPKTHETAHNAFNIFLFGCHKNWHSGPSEHNHITGVKKPSGITQKRRLTFDWQIANRLVDKFVIDHAYNRIESARLRYFANLVGYGPTIDTINEAEAEALSAEYARSTKFSIHMIRLRGSAQPQVTYRWETPAQSGQPLNPELIGNIVDTCFLCLTVVEQRNGLSLEGNFEYKRNGQVFRTHQNYRKGGPYNDFARITWERDTPLRADGSNSSSDSTGSEDGASVASTESELAFSVEASANRTTKYVQRIPAKLLCFLVYPDGTQCIMIHSCGKMSWPESVLTTRWRWEYKEDSNTTTDDEDSIGDRDSDPEGSDGNFDNEDVGRELPQYRDADNSNNLTPLLRIVTVDVLEKHCLMIPYHKKSKYMMHVIDQDKWAGKFLGDLLV
jgi:hypothetical protein